MYLCTATTGYWGGDFNVVSDPSMDRIGTDTGHVLKPNASCQLKSLCEEYDLLDIWRNKHIDTKRYTWFRRKPKLLCSRIDYYMVSECLTNRTKSCSIDTCTLSDHSLITLVLDTTIQKRGPGIWRINNIILQNEQYVEEMNSKLEALKQIYSYMAVDEFWELLKSEVAKFTKAFCRKSAKRNKIYRCNLYKTLETLQTEMIEKKECDDQLDLSIQRIQTAIDSSLEEEAKKSAFLCKARFIKDGEKNSKYFFGMGKRNYVNKTMYKVKKSDGSLTKDYREILNVQKYFYSTLYSSNKNIKFNIRNDSGILLSAEDKAKLETSVSEEELHIVLLSMKPNKVCGCDGLSREFYIKFWNTLKGPLIRMYRCAYNNNRLCESARRGVVQLIPKRGKNELLVASWRPLTILCYDYKILARALAMRLDTVMEDLIGPQQCGFMKGRSSCTNIMKTKEIVANLKKTNRPGVIISVDFNKCFDRVEY